MDFYPNGILLQQMDQLSTYLADLTFPYQGLDAYGTMPLCRYSSDVEARYLHEEYFDWLFDAEIGQKVGVLFSPVSPKVSSKMQGITDSNALAVCRIGALQTVVRGSCPESALYGI